MATPDETPLRILILDLLVERAAFGHGGNQEIVLPFTKNGPVEIFLVTPQMQSFDSGLKTEINPQTQLTEVDVSKWDYEFEFWESIEVDYGNKKVKFNRIIMPMHNNDEKMDYWLDSLNLDAVVCSGSRRNVSMWEDWMKPAASLLRTSATKGIPTLGICFGHQLLCHALGAKIERANKFSSGIWKLNLTKNGENDPLLTSHTNENEEINVVYSHQDHVMTVPKYCVLLSSTDHNFVTAVRLKDKFGDFLPTWGVQFHPEAVKARMLRAYNDGHITEEEFNSLKGEHDGPAILASFANIVVNR
mgnify:FL=1|tara:strand:+ start:30273 stop:31181 length:909 start_codon:yes stop_codon:yes gene_type:complete